MTFDRSTSLAFKTSAVLYQVLHNRRPKTPRTCASLKTIQLATSNSMFFDGSPNRTTVPPGRRTLNPSSNDGGAPDISKKTSTPRPSVIFMIVSTTFSLDPSTRTSPPIFFARFNLYSTISIPKILLAPNDLQSPIRHAPIGPQLCVPGYPLQTQHEQRCPTVPER